MGAFLLELVVKHFATLLLTGITSAILFYAKKIVNELRENRKQESQEQDILKHVVVVMLRYRLVALAKTVKEEGKTLENWETFETLYNDYRALGGNGLVKCLYEELERISFKEV